MKNSHLLLFIFSALLFSCAKNKPTVDNRITIGQIDSVYSEVLKEQRKIWVYVPESIKDKRYGEHHYPVLYLLDGDSHFHAVTGMMKDLAGNALCPEMIVVAIPNTDRSRDLTPTNSLYLPDGKTQQEWLKSTGGGENFTMFIEKELIPYIESHYPTAGSRMLIGHSFGGLFAINTLVHHPQLFNSYVAIDPSMWWDKQKLLMQADSVLKLPLFAKKTMFVSVANTMQKGMDTLHVSNDTASASFHIRSILQFARKANANKKVNGLRFDWKYYDKDDHGSVPFISEYDAFRFIFDYYKPSHLDDMTLGQLIDHYKNVSDKLGYLVPPQPELVNAAGQSALRKKDFELAYSFFDMNIKSYPNVQEPVASMGDYYLAKGDTVHAVEAYDKALKVEKNPYIQKKLDDLKK
jgi:uncharacterized protein